MISSGGNSSRMSNIGNPSSLITWKIRVSARLSSIADVVVSYLSSVVEAPIFVCFTANDQIRSSSFLQFFFQLCNLHLQSVSLLFKAFNIQGKSGTNSVRQFVADCRNLPCLCNTICSLACFALLSTFHCSPSRKALGSGGSADVD